MIDLLSLDGMLLVFGVHIFKISIVVSPQLKGLVFRAGCKIISSINCTNISDRIVDVVTLSMKTHRNDEMLLVRSAALSCLPVKFLF